MIFNPPTLTIDAVGKLSNVPDILVADVMQAFTMANPKHAEAQKRSAFAAQNVPKLLKHFSLEKDYISFPRGATRVVIDICRKRDVKLVLKDHRVSRPLKKKITFIGTLREYQEESVGAIMVNDFGVVEAGTGAGKTVIACAAIARKSVYTVICVPSKELMYQWVKRLCSFTDLKESDIGLVGDGLYEVKPITVALINTLARHSDELKGYFEYLVVDEAHRVAAEMYVGGPLTSLATKSMTGLSATLMRGDGLIDLLYWFVGRVLHKVDAANLRDIEAIMEPFVWQKETNFFSKKAEKNYSKMISEMVEDSSRNNLIASEVIADARWRAGQGSGLILVVSDRVAHLKTLYDLIAEQLGEEKVVLLTGQTVSKERKDIVERLDNGIVSVLVSTLSLIAEGFDCPSLSSCHFATPIADRKRVIQTAGRVLRPEDNKIPVIADYVDRRISMLKYRAKQRLEIFKKDIFGKVIMIPPWRKEEAIKRQSEEQKTVCARDQSKAPGPTQKQPPTLEKSPGVSPVRNQTYVPFRKQASLFDLPERQHARNY